MFGFEERLRIANHRAQLTLGQGAVIVIEGGSEEEEWGGITHGVLVRVEDVDRHHERAARGGARILRPPADHPYGERQYTAQDLGGHIWTFSQTIADVDPAVWGGSLLQKPG